LLAGLQALHIARQDARAALDRQVSAQLDALSQAVADAAAKGEYDTLQTLLKSPLAQGNLLFAGYVAPDGRSMREQAPPPSVDRPDWFAALAQLERPAQQKSLDIGGKNYGHLLIQPTVHAVEDFLWHLGTSLIPLLVGAFILLGWLIHVLLRINLKDLGWLRTRARQIEAGDYSARIPIKAICSCLTVS
jgi:hypothetical protein